MSDQTAEMADTTPLATPEASHSNTGDESTTGQSKSANEDTSQEAGNDSGSVPENTTESRGVPESPELRIAEREAKDAISETIKKMKALKLAATVNLSKELSELVAIMEEFQSGASTPRSRPGSRSTSRSTSRTRSLSPPRGPPRQVPGNVTVLPGNSKYKVLLNEERRPCAIGRISMDEWRREELPRDLYNRGRPGIDSLDPVIQAFYRDVPSVLTVVDKKYSDEDFKKAYDNMQNTEKPQRLRINSPFLLDDLERISGLTLPKLPHLMIPPFKLLICNWDGIKSTLEKLPAELEELQNRIESHKANTPLTKEGTDARSHQTTMPIEVSAQQNTENDVPRVDVSTQGAILEKDAEDGPKISRQTIPPSSSANIDEELVLEKLKLEIRISHLRVLHDFIISDLGYLVGLILKIKEASLEKINFESLYHLYTPGDLIINRKDDVDLLYQVYAVTGGRTRLLKYTNLNGYRPPMDDQEADNSPEAGIGTWTDVVIDSFRMRWDGTRVGPRRMTHRVQHYIGEKKITDLDYYPVRFRSNAEELCSKLKLRGKAVVECYGHKKYDGVTAKPISAREPVRLNKGPPPVRPPQNMSASQINRAEREIDGDVYVDLKVFGQTFSPMVFDRLGRVRPSVREVTESFVQGQRDRDYHAGDHDVDEARSDRFLSNHFHLMHPKRPEELEGIEDYLMLLPQSIPAFEFRQREWVYLDIDKIEDIDKSDEARRRGWEDLVINEGYSQLLLSLVDNHTSAYDHKRKKNESGHSVPTSQIDLIKGKGRGLIILLHGPPGTGKTSTAETIAAYTGKPLYAITCGDIGVTASDVEDSLREHTERAEKWGCVLLLDEADVFLAKRTWTDMNRNALVSVFLRHMEYYTGILFLTTNIVGIIDEAFKSRIHVALRYESIDLDSTEKIWNNLLDRILKDNESSNIKIKFDRDILLEFAQSHYERHAADETTWNARQIRNAFSTAIAMGQFDRLERVRKEGLKAHEVEASGKKSLMTIRLTKNNFSKIANTAADFEEYINAVRGSDAENALANQQRDDYFLSQLAPVPRRRNRGGPGDHYHGPKRHEYLTPQSSKPAKGKKTAKKLADTYEEDEDDEDDEVSPGNRTRLAKEEFSDDDESDE